MRKDKKQHRTVAGRIPSGILAAVLVAIASPGMAQTILSPGESRVLDVADDMTCELVLPLQIQDPTVGSGEFCVNRSPTPSCVTDAAARTLKIDAGLGFYCTGVFTNIPELEVEFPGGPIRSATAIGRLINVIEIEAATTPQRASESLPVQISTEVSWDGILFPLYLWLPPTQSQVVATLQVRDKTTEKVVASKTFLFERSGPTKLGEATFHLDLNTLPPTFGLNNPFDFLVSIDSSTGVDLIANLLRGREYAIEVEAKCEHTNNYLWPSFVPTVIGLPGGCFFGAEENVNLVTTLNNFTDDVLYDGFTIAPITVTVLDDRTELMANGLLATTVEIDIKPGNSENPIDLRSQGDISVAIFSSPEFDATTVDPLTIALAGSPVSLEGNGQPKAQVRDVNKDGLKDLEVKVNTGTLELDKTDVSATLTGRTFDGSRIKGLDSIWIVPPRETVSICHVELGMQQNTKILNIGVDSPTVAYHLDHGDYPVMEEVCDAILDNNCDGVESTQAQDDAWCANKNNDASSACVRATSTCVAPQDTTHTVLAIAYIENNGVPGFNPPLDILITKITDENESGIIDGGDLIVANHFPTRYDNQTPFESPIDTRPFRLKYRVLPDDVVVNASQDSISIRYGSRTDADDPWVMFTWADIPTIVEFYTESLDNDGVDRVSSLYDYVSPYAADVIDIHVDSAMQPTATRNPLLDDDPDLQRRDNARFLNVEIYLP